MFGSDIYSSIVILGLIIRYPDLNQFPLHHSKSNKVHIDNLSKGFINYYWDLIVFSPFSKWFYQKSSINLTTPALRILCLCCYYPISLSNSSSYLGLNYKGSLFVEMTKYNYSASRDGFYAWVKSQF